MILIAELCSPVRKSGHQHFSYDIVQSVPFELQRPDYSCGSKQNKVPDHGIKSIDSVLIKFQRPTELSHYGLGQQDPEET